jgi:multidrug transporter EmrE-like cation transporter
MLLFEEAASLVRLLCVCLILSGIIGLTLVTPH